MSPIARALNALRGRLALIHEAYWLAIADLPHSDECAMETCEHYNVECPHSSVDCTCNNVKCACECTCWHSAADKVASADEAEKLYERLRDAEDAIEALTAELDRAKNVISFMRVTADADTVAAADCLMRGEP